MLKIESSKNARISAIEEQQNVARSYKFKNSDGDFPTIEHLPEC